MSVDLYAAIERLSLRRTLAIARAVTEPRPRLRIVVGGGGSDTPTVRVPR